MQLSDGERLLVVMLADLMEHVGVSREVDPALIKRLVINKDDWALEWRYHGIFNGESGPTDAEVRETSDILSMMSYIEYSVSELDEDARSQIEASNRLRFRGFDGNNDPHHGIAHTIIHDLNRFSEFADRDLNSHSQATLAHYRRMLPIYNSFQNDSVGGPLNFEQLQALATYEAG